ncbi:Ku domain-containing protein [Mycena chlorophos]|uniref:ATP-dependent DNA helicase II subunit 2 n=1 Tax=Mycena chlorophos TaxID=658473 RepID=A0A8H6W986_MYCCL|nr:Ku domain-containing protein [Mycena chlorophos]
MPAERAGYTVTMFVVDIGPTMAKTRTHDAEGNELPQEITNLQWGLQFVKLKIQEMIFNGRKTDKCGVILMGSTKTRNILNKAMKDGYEHIEEYIKIDQPNPATLAKLDALETTDETGDALDALIVAMETQEDFLASKKTWTRKMVLVTDAETPIEVDNQLKPTVKKMNAYGISLTIVGIDFDAEDEDFQYEEEDKSDIKRENERFFQELVSKLDDGIVGSCAYALREIARPDVKITKSVLMGTTLRIGDMHTRPEEALEINIKTSKCTALSRPKSWKKFALRGPLTEEQKAALALKRAQKKKPGKMQDGDESVTESDTEDDEPVKMEVDDDEEEPGKKKAQFVQLKMRTEYYVDKREKNDDGDAPEEVEVKKEEEEVEEAEQEEGDQKIPAHMSQVNKEELIRGFKYGETYVPCPDGQFERLPTKKGIEICGFFPAKNFRRELSMGEIQYIWGDPSQPAQQVAISSIAQAMYEKDSMAIARWVSKDGMDAKMGVIAPCIDEGVDFLLWSHMPFADDVRKFMFPSLDTLISKKGEQLTEHAFLPTQPQLDAMDAFVDAMDLMDAGEKDDDGNRTSWFDTRLSYNPAVHRIKQAQFHAAVVSDLSSNPVPPAHPELLTYFTPPKRALKRSRDAIESCKDEFNVKQVPKKVARTRANGHVHAQDAGEGLLLDSRRELAFKRQTTREDVDDEPMPDPEPASPAPKSRSSSPKAAPTTTSTSNAPMDLDDDDAEIPLSIPDGRKEGRIIGNTRPLMDFRANLARGDIVTKAVEDMCVVVEEIALGKFASRRHPELIECMTALRETCLKEDEVEAWNDFMRAFKKKLTKESPGNKEFWGELQTIGRPMSLISDKEVEDSDVSETGAKKFIA